MQSIHEQAKSYLQYAQNYKDSTEIKYVLQDMAAQLSMKFKDKFPLFLNVIGHSSYFSTHLMSNLNCDAQIDQIQLTPIDSNNDISWRVIPNINVTGRDVVILDDILDDGKTMQAIVSSLKEWGANSVCSAVLCNKHNDNKLIEPDYSAFKAPKNSYLFGFGMSIYGYWSHLPNILILNSQ
jgi:hypoxanthine phosphoribosyltransferase